LNTVEYCQTPRVRLEFARRPYHPPVPLAVGRGRLTLAAVLCVLMSFAPWAWPAPAHAASFDFGGVPRTYTVHVPAGVERPTGLVVNLHAAGATGQDQAALTHYDAVSDANGFLVVYPDGIDLSWADGRGASVPDRQGIDDVGFITALVGKLVTDYGIDPGRVFATGLSAGAFMANRLACDRADNERVSDVEGSVLHQYSRNGTAPLVQLGFQNSARGGALWICLQRLNIRHQQNHFKQ